MTTSFVRLVSVAPSRPYTGCVVSFVTQVFQPYSAYTGAIETKFYLVINKCLLNIVSEFEVDMISIPPSAALKLIRENASKTRSHFRTGTGRFIRAVSPQDVSTQRRFDSETFRLKTEKSDSNAGKT